MPSSSSLATVLGPMPGTRPGEASANRSRAPSAVSSRKPSGFSASDATFATSLLGPMPTLHVSPVSALTASLTARAAERCRSSPVRSRYASSRPTTSTRSTCCFRTAMTSLERERYASKSGGMNTASGHSRRARSAGVAEKTPYRRAS